MFIIGMNYDRLVVGVGVVKIINAKAQTLVDGSNRDFHFCNFVLFLDIENKQLYIDHATNKH